MKRLLVVGAVLALAGVALATTVIPMSVDELTTAANTVVEARALSSWSQWQGTVIYTYTRFRTVKPLKGAAPAEFVVKQLGGTVGNITQVVPGIRHFLDGEDTVLFLRPSVAADDTHVIVGLMQGHFRVYAAHSGDVMATNGTPGVSVVRHGEVREFTGSPMTLRKLEQLVRGAQQ